MIPHPEYFDKDGYPEKCYYCGSHHITYVVHDVDGGAASHVEYFCDTCGESLVEEFFGQINKDLLF